MTVHTQQPDCIANECVICAERECPHGEPLHYHHDGCPACETEASEIYPHDPEASALVWAAGRLNYHQFCEALHWTEDQYAADRYHDFAQIGRLLARFDGAVLRRLVDQASKL